MPYALFTNDAQISNAYPTAADVWKLARQSDLVDVGTDAGKPDSPHALDNNYEIRPCLIGPNEDPARNKTDAARQSRIELLFES
jgi:hypothetical protein